MSLAGDRNAEAEAAKFICAMRAAFRRLALSGLLPYRSSENANNIYRMLLRGVVVPPYESKLGGKVAAWHLLTRL